MQKRSDSLFINDKGKLYRLLFNMNKDTEIQVRIAVGQTNEKEHGENIG